MHVRSCRALSGVPIVIYSLTSLLQSITVDLISTCKMMKFATVAFVAAVINCVREGVAAPSNLTSDQTLLWTESSNFTDQTLAAPSNGIDQTLSRLGDLVPVATGILNQECKHLLTVHRVRDIKLHL